MVSKSFGASNKKKGKISRIECCQQQKKKKEKKWINLIKK